MAYVHNVFQAIAARQLQKAGVQVTAGQTVQYLIVDYKDKKPTNRILVAELTELKTCYDIEKYLDLLISAAETILSPFSYTKEKLHRQIIHEQKQTIIIS